MKKINNRSNRNIIIRTIVYFFLVILFISVGYALLNQNFTVSGSVTLSNQNVPKACDEYDTYSVEGYTGKFELNSWGNNPTYYQYHILLTNDSSSTIGYWEVKLYVNGDVQASNSWNVSPSVDGNVVTLECIGSSCSVNSGKYADFGVQIIKSGDPIIIEKVEINGEVATGSGNVVHHSDSCTSGGGGGHHSNPDQPDNPDDPDDPITPVDGCDYSLGLGTIACTDGKVTVTVNTGQAQTYNGMTWNQYDFTITNNTSDGVNGWSFVLNTAPGSAVNTSWNCNYVNKDSTFEFSQMSNNAYIAPGQTVTAGIIIGTPQNYTSSQNAPARSKAASKSVSKPPISYVPSLVSSYSDRGTYYYQYEFKVSNDSESEISFWNTSIYLDGAKVSSAWNCKYKIEDGYLYVENEDYNGVIPADQYKTFSVIFSSTDPDFKPSV